MYREGDMSEKIMLRIKVLIPLLIIIIYIYYIFFYKYGNILSNSDDPKIIQLYKVNNELNKAISKKDWQKVYEIKCESFVDGIKNKKPIKSSFIRSLKDNYFWSILNVKIDSVCIIGNKAKVKNKWEGRTLIFPFIKFITFAYHSWEYENNKWYLLDWGAMYLDKEKYRVAWP